MCEAHWAELRTKIKVTGMFDLVAGQNEVMERMVKQLEGNPTTLQNFDPLMAANNMLWGNALHAGGLYMIGVDEHGMEYCPVCEANSHEFYGWIDRAVETVVAFAKTLQAGHQQPPSDIL